MKKEINICNVCRSKDYCGILKENIKDVDKCLVFNYSGDYYTFRQEFCNKICDNNICSQKDETITNCLANLGDQKANNKLRIQEEIAKQNCEKGNYTLEIKFPSKGVAIEFLEENSLENCNWTLKKERKE